MRYIYIHILRTPTCDLRGSDGHYWEMRQHVVPMETSWHEKSYVENYSNPPCLGSCANAHAPACSCANGLDPIVPPLILNESLHIENYCNSLCLGSCADALDPICICANVLVPDVPLQISQDDCYFATALTPVVSIQISVVKKLHIENYSNSSCLGNCVNAHDPMVLIQTLADEQLQVQNYSSSPYLCGCANNDEDKYRDCRHRCFHRKFTQREHRKSNAKLEDAVFAEALKHHNDMQHNVFYDVEAADYALVDGRSHYRNKPFSIQAGIGLQGKRLQRYRRARCEWLVSLVVCFCLYDRSPIEEINDATCARWMGELPTTAGAQRQQEIDSEGSSTSQARRHNVGVTEEMKWLKWRKTRDEIFGQGQEPWCESWAFSLIFGDGASTKQHYLWSALVQGRHRQWGQGVLLIPSNGTRDLRERRRRVLAARKLGHPGHGALELHSADRGGGSGAFDAADKHAADNAAHVPVGTGNAGDVEMASDSAAGSIHTFRYSELCERREALPGQDLARLKANRYVIESRVQDGPIPDYVRAIAGPATSVDTEGLHCACAVHAVFGKPSGNGKLTAPGARTLAWRLLSSAPAKAGLCAQVARNLDGMIRTFWEEFVLRHFRREDTAESKLSSWDALSSAASHVEEDSQQKYNYAVSTSTGKRSSSKTRGSATSWTCLHT